MPSSTAVLQAATNASFPLISTMQTRQAPISFKSFKKQRVGILIPTDAAAFKIVVPFSTFTS